MNELTAFLLACWGIVGAWTLLAIGKPISVLCKKIHPILGKLVACPGCLGFWVGCFISIFAINPAAHLIVDSFPDQRYIVVVSIFVSGLMSSGFCLFMHTLTSKLHIESQIHSVNLASYQMQTQRDVPTVERIQ